MTSLRTPAGSDVDSVLADHDVVGHWSEKLNGRLMLLRVLLPAERTEAVSDAICEERFGGESPFRLMLLPVEATLPKLEEPAKPDRADVEPVQPAAPERVSREEL